MVAFACVRIATHHGGAHGPQVDVHGLSRTMALLRDSAGRGNGMWSELQGVLIAEKLRLADGVVDLAQASPDGVPLGLDFLGELDLVVVLERRIGNHDEGDPDAEAV